MVLVGNTVFSNFVKTNRLNLLIKVFEKVYVTEQVLEEFRRGLKGVFYLKSHLISKC